LVVTKRSFEALGPLESPVMDLVWRQSHVTAREVCDLLTGRKERAYTTIMTTLDRLHRKGLLLREKEGLAWRYRPALSKAEFERALAERLATEILQTHGSNALSAFVDAAADVDEALLDQLSRLIAARRKGGR
jgi:predicted transcriptional regulator